MQLTNYFSLVRVWATLISLTTLYSCDPELPEPENPEDQKSFMMYNTSKEVYASLLTDLPQGVASEEKLIFTLPNHSRFTAISVSPTGKYGAIATYTSSGSDSKKYKGNVRLYQFPDGELVKEYAKADFIEMVDYPVSEASMYVVKLSWMNDKELLIHMSPQTYWIESVPYNISMILDVTTDEVVQLQYSPVNSWVFEAPTHPSKTKYSGEIRNKYLHINNTKVQDLRQLEAFDAVYDVEFPEGESW